MGRTGRQEEKCEGYKFTAERMLLYSYIFWAEKIKTSIRNKTFKTRKNK